MSQSNLSKLLAEKEKLLEGCKVLEKNGDVSLSLGFDNVEVTVRRKGRRVVNGAWGYLEGGELGCIVGPSGSGKTTLVNVLAGRIREGRVLQVTRRVAFGGRLVDQEEQPGLRSIIGYVEQSDETLVATSTPREALQFAAALRVPDAMLMNDSKQTAAQARSEMVEGVLRALGLEKCADDRIGNVRRRGISGGEKRRTSIGVELLTRPRILFMDEATSGLDSASANSVIAVLRVVADHAGTTTLSTLHQPTSAILFAHSRVIVLSCRGQTAYQGPTDRLAEHLESRNIQVPVHFNPADVALDVVADVELDDPILQPKPTDFLDECSPTKKSGEKDDIFASASQQGRKIWWARQLALLSRRRFREMRREGLGYAIRLGIGVVLTTIYGLLFANAGDRDDEKPANMATHYGALTFLIIACQQGASSVALVRIPQERPVFLREYRNGMYDYWTYYLVQATSEMPVVLFEEILKNSIAYSLFDLDGDFSTICLITFLLSISTASMASMLTATFNSVDAAQALLPVVLVPQMLFSGFFVRIEQIPKLLRWGRWLCSLRYALSAILINEFQCQDNKTCSVMLKDNKVRELSLLHNILILLGTIPALQLIGAYCLKRSANPAS